MKNKIDDYLKYLKVQRNYSNYTIENYNEDLIFFKSYLGKENLDYTKIEYKDIRTFFNFLDENKYSKNTIYRK